MKLFVIIICLLSERYLIHTLSSKRQIWLNQLFDQIKLKASWDNPYLLLSAFMLPLISILALVLWFLGDALFGLVELLVNIIIFYFSLGPTNPFYPESVDKGELIHGGNAGYYLNSVHNQLFAVIILYILLGPIAALSYRLLSFSQNKETIAALAQHLVALIDWLLVRVTALLYLLAGNFQQGFNTYCKMIKAVTRDNALFLSTIGILAAQTQPDKPVLMMQAQDLVEHALVILMVILSLLTLVACL